MSARRAPVFATMKFAFKLELIVVQISSIAISCELVKCETVEHLCVWKVLSVARTVEWARAPLCMRLCGRWLWLHFIIHSFAIECRMVSFRFGGNDKMDYTNDNGYSGIQTSWQKDRLLVWMCRYISLSLSLTRRQQQQQQVINIFSRSSSSSSTIIRTV